MNITKPMVSRETETGPRLFSEEPSSVLLCSSCHKIMIEPVTMKCGHSFCKLCAKSMDKCIKDGTKLDRNYFPNLALSQQVQELVVHCKFGMHADGGSGKFVIDVTGCPEKCVISNIDKHESTCQFRSSQCRCGQQILAKNLETHTLHCQYVKKPTSKFIGADPNSKMTTLSKNPDFMSGLGNSSSIRRTSHRSSLYSEDLETSSEVQRISDNLTLRMRRFETQMNGSLSRMENMFAETQAMFNTMMVMYQSQLVSSSNDKELLTCTNNQHSRSHSIASGSSFNTVAKWTNPFEFLHAGTLRGHKCAITSCVSRDVYLFTGYHNGVIRGWNISLFMQGEFGKVLQNGECIAVLRGHKQPIQSLFIRDHSEELVSFDKFEIRIWSLKTFSAICEINLDAYNLSLRCIAITKQFLLMSGEKKISVLSLDRLDGNVIGEVLFDSDPRISTMKIYPPDTVIPESSSDKRQVQLYCGGHNEVQVWNIEKISKSTSTENYANCPNVVLKKHLVIKHQYYSISSMLVSPCYVIIGTYNRNIQLFNRTTGEHIFSLTGHVSSVNDIAMTDNESHLVSVGAEGYVNIWETFRQTLIQSIRVQEDFSASGVIVRGEVIFVVGSDGEIKLYRYDRIR